MISYPKIPNIFMRDPDTKKLIPGKYENDELMWLENSPWEFTEKIDGTNIRIGWDGYRVEIGGRTDRSQIQSGLDSYLRDTFCTQEAEELFEHVFGGKEAVLFGEGTGPKIQTNGSLYAAEPKYILFDVLINGNWLSRENVQSVASALRLDTAPVLFTGTLPDGVAYVSEKDRLSEIAELPVVMEGIVGHPVGGFLSRHGDRISVKIKRRDFV